MCVYYTCVTFVRVCVHVCLYAYATALAAESESDQRDSGVQNGFAGFGCR